MLVTPKKHKTKLFIVVCRKELLRTDVHSSSMYTFICNSMYGCVEFEGEVLL